MSDNDNEVHDPQPTSPDPQPTSSENTIRELRELVAALHAQQEQSQQAIQALSSKPAAPPAVSHVVVPRERKIPTFTGSESDSWNNVEDFIEEVEGIFRARDMSVDVAVDFVLSHLQNPARDELKLRQKTARNTAPKIFTILREAFGEKRSLPQLLKAFYDRYQQPGENILEFSHALRKHFQRVVTKCPSAADDSDTTLRDTFVDNLRDPLLRKELKRMIRSSSSVTFLDVREEALRWSEDDTADHHAVIDKVQAHASPHRQPGLPFEEASFSHPHEQHNPPQEQPSPPPSSELSALIQAMARQQDQLNDLTQAIQSLKAAPSQSQTAQDAKPHRNLTCYNCQKRGHVARNCRSAPRNPQPTPNYPNFPSQPQQQFPPPPPNPWALYTPAHVQQVQPTPDQAAQAGAVPNSHPLSPGAKPQGGY